MRIVVSGLDVVSLDHDSIEGRVKRASSDIGPDDPWPSKNAS